MGQSKSLNLAFSKSQQYKALFFINCGNKPVNTFKFTVPRAIAQQHRRHLLRPVSKFCNVCWAPSSLWWCRRPWSEGDGKKAGSVTEAQRRQEWRDGSCSFRKIFLFCKYLTWIIQIRTCWWGAGCCFYSHLFRESTENTLQHGHSGPKKRKNGSFCGRRTQRVKNSWWLAGRPAGTCPAR